ncbi:hypothetical protein D3Z45_20295 [Lachnospiraceae bacterium]|nr:hypothetical protein [Lachnospiraceae bacterium]
MRKNSQCKQSAEEFKRAKTAGSQYLYGFPFVVLAVFACHTIIINDTMFMQKQTICMMIYRAKKTIQSRMQ